MEAIDEDNAGEFADTDFEETRTTRSSKTSTDKPVTNAGDIPLFADSDKRGMNTAAHLKITKLDQPGAGYKDDIPVSSTLKTIAQLWGNGIYNIELCNDQNKCLRKMEGVRISIDQDKGSESKTNGTTAGSDPQMRDLIRGQHLANEKNTERLLELARVSGTEAKELAQAHTELVTTTTQSAAEREREHMAGVNKSQQDFFGNMMLMQANMFQQTMALLTAGHQQTMESMRATNDRDRDQNNPLVLMQILKEGIALGKDTEGDDREPWERAIESGAGALESLLLLKDGGASPGRKLPPNTRPNPATAGKPATPPNNKKELAFTPDEAKAMLKLKHVLGNRGIDFLDMLTQNSNHYAQVANNELFGDTDNSETLEGNANDPGDETSETSVADGENSESGDPT